MGDRVYYRVAKDSPVMAIIRDAEAQWRKFREAVKVLSHEFPGATIWTFNNAQVCGVCFVGDAPPGWRDTRRGFSVPNERLKSGRDAAKRLKQMPRGVDAMQFSGMMSRGLKQEYSHWANNRVCWTVFEKCGKVYILSVPVECEVSPTGCVEMKMSKYWKIHERAQANAGVKG